MWYGQKETDKVIASFFDADYIGSCVEVGVADGIKGSNTKYFEDKGWDCLCIDPIPEHVLAARKVRKNVIEAACSNKITTSSFFVVDLGEKNIKSSLSSLSIDNRLLVTHGNLINNVKEIKVKTDLLSNLIVLWKDSHKIDFISIDTEGTELDVLKGLDIKNFDIKLLVVENNFNDDNISYYLNQFGYKKAERYFVNDFYIKN